ncbi:FAD:protein FMN transferase [Sphingomonas insulae]|uniref:FAD:protein FMN transferase n=1 Tax=Sphingomonas insulae TaxID=424800 RepID=UPI00201215FA|nr:FAD:protein FMN transferase [Sphingomonas insulae]
MRIALPAVIDPAAVAAHDPAAAIVDLGGETMGTRWHVRAVLPAGMTVAAVGAAIVARLDGIVNEMSHWSPTSRLSRFNRADAGAWVTLPPDFAHVVAGGLAIAAATGGAFDPTIGRLVELWGFGPTPVTTSPTDFALAQAKAATGWQRLTYTPGDRRLRQPGGLSLDLSGIAKGHAVDAIADVLAQCGVRHALTEIGGEFVGRGIRPDGEPWWVDLEVPPGSDLAPLRIALHRLAVATSGDYRRGAHTIDPRTGRSVANGVVSASVIHADALTADAWATALTVLGPGEGGHWRRRTASRGGS